MAKGWRRFLEEESEHQWLAISLFFVFIIIGAFAIHGTSKLTGMDIKNNSALENSRVLEISYQDYETIIRLVIPVKALTCIILLMVKGLIS